jgi:hypothetical protein
MSKRWTKEEDVILIDNYRLIGTDKCMELLPFRSWTAVHSRVQFLGLQIDYIERFIKDVTDRGGIPLFDKSKWIDSRTRYLVRCKCGYEWGCSPVSLRCRGDWCKSCSGHLKKTPKDYRDLATKFGGIWLGEEAPTNNKIDTKWRCIQGHEFSNDYNNIQQYNCFCRYCKNPYLGQAVTKMYLEGLTGKIFETIRPKFLTYENGHPLELDGYNGQIKVAFEYNGLEHYKKSSRQSQEALENLQRRDAWKKRKAVENGIKLLIIDEIDGIFDQNHIRKSVISFLIKESVDMVVDPGKFYVDLISLYDSYFVKKIQDYCLKLNLTLLSKEYLNSNTKVKIKCNKCAKERMVIPGNLHHAVFKGKIAYCKCTRRSAYVEKI